MLIGELAIRQTLLNFKKLSFFNKTFNKFGVGNVVKSISGLNLIISLTNPNIAKKVFLLFKPIICEFDFYFLSHNVSCFIVWV